MRVVSLAPSATELLFALGLDDDVVGVTHACDHPPAAQELPRVTRTRSRGEPARATHAPAGAGPYELDVERLHELAPDLIVIELHSGICAASPPEIRALAEELDSQPLVIALEAHTLGEILGGARTLAQATDAKEAAVDLIRESSVRIDRIRLAVRGAKKPRVAALDGLDPPRGR